MEKRHEIRGELGEIVSAYTHFFGALLSLLGLIILIAYADGRGPFRKVTWSVFGASMILLYLTSGIYHICPINHRFKSALRRLDHTMIYVLIAGTYTPVSLLVFKSPWSWILFTFVWLFALVGIMIKIKKKNLAYHLSAIVYLVMGCSIIPYLIAFRKELNIYFVYWLIAGGAFYTVGILFYSGEQRFPKWYMHEIFHVLTMGGTFCHFWAIIFYT